jgi:adenylosuccinate synthase
VIGVSKAYITRVGGGPFPTEAFDHSGEQIRTRGKEFGAVTGRPRRCGWFDVPLLRYTATINGFDSIVVTKLDVLDAFDQIPVCVAYRIGGKEVCGMPPTVAEIARIEPVYECVPGWTKISASRTTNLPARAKAYIAFLEIAPASRSAAFPPAPNAVRPSSVGCVLRNSSASTPELSARI